MQCDLILRPGSEYATSFSPSLGRVAAVLLILSLAACGDNGEGNGFAVIPTGAGGGGGGGGGSGWTAGVFQPAASFQARCANPRTGNNPNGFPWPDVQGTSTDENNFLRSYSDDTYLWYDEITDRDPGLFTTPAYFELLITEELTLSGNPKDNFHFSQNTDEWIAQSQSGTSGGYGAQFALLDTTAPDRVALVAFTDPNTPATGATAALVRGTEILMVDGANVADGDADVLNAGLFPETPGEAHSFMVRDPDGTERSFSMTSAIITSTPVQNVSTIPTATGDVGYLLFNDHIATSELGLFNAINQLDAANVSDLVIDMRYNGGGFLDIAAELAYMIAGNVPTAGQTFELIQFNDKHPVTDPVTGAAIAPIPFHNAGQGFSVANNTQLPTLDLPRVFVLTGPGTCSASEAVMNGLRGVGVDVIQIGSTTCGKPYGFYPTDNCGTTYFTIQFRGVNAQNVGDYSDGFSPANTVGAAGVSVPGCSVADDFSAPLGDPTEARLAAALEYRASNLMTCPTPSGTAAPPGVSKLTLQSDEDLVLPKSRWRENRIIRR